MDAYLSLPDTEYGTDICTPRAIVRPMLVKGKAGIGVLALRGKLSVVEISPEDARRLGWEMIEIANRAEAARSAGATYSPGLDRCLRCGSRGPLDCPICKLTSIPPAPIIARRCSNESDENADGRNSPRHAGDPESGASQDPEVYRG